MLLLIATWVHNIVVQLPNYSSNSNSKSVIYYFEITTHQVSKWKYKFVKLEVIVNEKGSDLAGGSNKKRTHHQFP